MKRQRPSFTNLVPKQTGPPAAAHVVARAQFDRWRRAGRTVRANARQLDTLENVDRRIALTSPWRYDEWFRYYFTFRDTEKLPEVRIVDDKLELQKLEPPPQLTEEDFFTPEQLREQRRKERRFYEGRDDDEASVGWTEIEEVQRQDRLQKARDADFLFDADRLPRDPNDPSMPLFESNEDRERYTALKRLYDTSMEDADPEQVRAARNAEKEAEKIARKQQREAEREAERLRTRAEREAQQGVTGMRGVRDLEDPNAPTREQLEEERRLIAGGAREARRRNVDIGAEEVGEVPREQMEGVEEQEPEPPEIDLTDVPPIPEEGEDDDFGLMDESEVSDMLRERERRARAMSWFETAPALPNFDMSSSVLMPLQPDTRGGASLSQQERGWKTRYSRQPDSVTRMLKGPLERGRRSSIPVQMKRVQQERPSLGQQKAQRGALRERILGTQ